MTMSSVSAAPALAVLSNPQRPPDLQSEVAVRMLKRANDQMTEQGQALISLVDRVGQANQAGLDTYA